MIRRATHHDLERVREMIRAQHRASKYAGITGIASKALLELTTHALLNQNRQGVEGTFFHVVERDGQVAGFLIGMLSRVYLIGQNLVAQDAFFVVDEARPFDHARLVRAYVRWAQANPWVIEVHASWTDALPGAEKVGKLYERIGFKRVGGIYSIMLGAEQSGEMAA